ncbi:MAG TPA: HEPN domain-containing protein [Ignavibacteriaceae bacterium]|nr:HEPN domain-containing protein [Ignavibacteriaceae bacterium]
MSQSQKYNKLIKRLDQLKVNLLPSVRGKGYYNKKEQDFMRGYRLLVHAELEAYFEERAKDKAIKAYKDWDTKGIKSNILVALVAYSDANLGSIKSEPDIHKRVNKALTTYITFLKKNNGVKEDNILSILLPIGIKPAQLDQTWLNVMTSFGASRGEVAHNSHKTVSPIDLVTELTTVTHIINELKNVDTIINSLK